MAACRPISERPKVVVMGFLERKTGLFLASKRSDRTAQAMPEAAEEAFASFPDGLCLTLTLDNGKENACHVDLLNAFIHPASS